MEGNNCVEIVNGCLYIATVQLAEWLEQVLPKLNDWWNKLVLSSLDIKQRSEAIDKGYAHLNEFDLSPLIIITKNNLNLISSDPIWRSNMKYKLNELKEVRNHWAHKDGKEPNKNTAIQDLSTIKDVFQLILVSTQPIDEAIQKIKGVTKPPLNAKKCMPNKKISNSGELLFTVGDVWEGDNYADMINSVLGTDYKQFMRTAVQLSKFGGKGFAWFVFMDGTVHGHKDDYLFTNTLSADGETITERCVSSDMNYVKGVAKMLYGNALAFQRDPDGDGSKYKCKFVGYFQQISYDKKTLVRVYKKISDTYRLNMQ